MKQVGPGIENGAPPAATESKASTSPFGQSESTSSDRPSLDFFTSKPLGRIAAPTEAGRRRRPAVYLSLAAAASLMIFTDVRWWRVKGDPPSKDAQVFMRNAKAPPAAQDDSKASKKEGPSQTRAAPADLTVERRKEAERAEFSPPILRAAGDEFRSIASATQPPSPPLLPAGLRLKAIVIFGAKKSAFISCDLFPGGKWMTEGQAIQGWTITAMRGGFEPRVILKNGDHSLQLAINSAAGSRPPTDAKISANSAGGGSDKGGASGARGTSDAPANHSGAAGRQRRKAMEKLRSGAADSIHNQYVR